MTFYLFCFIILYTLEWPSVCPAIYFCISLNDIDCPAFSIPLCDVQFALLYFCTSLNDLVCAAKILEWPCSCCYTSVHPWMTLFMLQNLWMTFQLSCYKFLNGLPFSFYKSWMTFHFPCYTLVTYLTHSCNYATDKSIPSYIVCGFIYCKRESYITHCDMSQNQIWSFEDFQYEHVHMVSLLFLHRITKNWFIIYWTGQLYNCV